MEHRFAEEIYFDSLQLSKGKQVPTSTGNGELHIITLGFHVSDGDDVWEGGSRWDDSKWRLDNSSDLDREWQRRRDQFFTIGYRGGLIAGKEVCSQEGFNMDISSLCLLGTTGVLFEVLPAFLPDGLREMIIEAQKKGDKYQQLYESVHSLSTSDALKLFSDEIFSNGNNQYIEESIAKHQVITPSQSSEPSQIRAYVGKLRAAWQISCY